MKNPPTIFFSLNGLAYGCMGEDVVGSVLIDAALADALVLLPVLFTADAHKPGILNLI